MLLSAHFAVSCRIWCCSGQEVHSLCSSISILVHTSTTASWLSSAINQFHQFLCMFPQVCFSSNCPMMYITRQTAVFVFQFVHDIFMVHGQEEISLISSLWFVGLTSVSAERKSNSHKLPSWDVYSIILKDLATTGLILKEEYSTVDRYPSYPYSVCDSEWIELALDWSK